VEDPTARRDRIDNEHLKLMLALSLREDANCIDVGAHTGEILAEIVRVAPAGRHIAYEPLPGYAAELQNRFPQVDVRAAALCDVSGKTTFRYVRNLPGMSGLRERCYPVEPDIEVITVPTERLDDALPPGYAPSLIKIDVEGAELLVLEGARHTILTHHPVIVVEYGQGNMFSYGARPVDIYGALCGDAGYRIFDLDGRGPYSLTDFQHARVWQFVAH
jgi:FkbM family methyltransferase